MPGAEEIYGSFLERVQRGESPDLDQLCEQHPHLTDALRQMHSRYGMTMLPGPMGPPVGSGNTPAHNETFLEATIDDPETGTAAAEIVPSSETARFYRIEGEIDRGGMGVILRVWDENLKRHLAMKMIRGQQMSDDSCAPTTSAALMARFIREAEITGQLDHPGVVPVHDIGQDERGRQYFTMRLIRGESLAAVNKQLRAGSGKWTPTRVLEVIVKVCDTLAYAHSKGVIHRDLKPANIMVGEFGETYVMDWGLAKVIDEPSTAHAAAVSKPVSVTAGSVSGTARDFGSGDMTLDGSVIGTPAYMPPEQASGRVQDLDARSDIYSVGTMLYELLAQVKPYGDDRTNVSQFDILRAVNAGPPTPIPQVNPKVPAEVVAICEKAMARSKEDRYATISEMAEDLRAYLENRVVRAYSTGAFAEFRKWVRRNRGVAAASAVAFLFLLAGLGTVIEVQRLSNEEIVAEKEQKETARVRAEKAREEADRQRDEADRQRQSVEGLLLAAQSKETLNQQKPTSAILLALESLDRISSYEANTILLAALDQHNEERMLEGHEDAVASAVYSPDGTSILTASHDHTAIIWDAQSGQRRTLLLGHSRAVRSAAFSHDGKLAVTASYDQQAAIWDVATGRRLIVLHHNQPVLAAQFSPDGSLVATAGVDNQVHIWHAESGKSQWILTGHTRGDTDYIRLLRFSANGTRLISGSADGIACIWNVASGERIAVLDVHGQSVTTAEFSPDGQYVVTAGAVTGTPPNSEAQLFDAETGKLLATLDGASAAAAAFSSSGDRIAVGCGDGTVRIWDVEEQAFTQRFEAAGGWITQVDFSPDDGILLAVTSGNTVITWDTASGTQLARMLGHSDSILGAQFSPDGTHVVTCSADSTARIWRTDHRSVMPQFRHSDAVDAVKLTQDRMVAFVGERRTPWLWSISDGRLIAILPHSEPVSGTSAFSPDGDVLLTFATDGHAYLWSAHDGRPISTLHDTGAVSNVVFSPDGQSVLLASSEDNVVSKLDLTTYEMSRRMPLSGPMQQIPGPNGRYCLALEQQVGLQLLDLDAGTTVRSVELGGQFVNARFSSDGKSFLVFSPAQSSIRVWSVTTEGEPTTVDVGGMIEVAEFGPHGESLFAVAHGDRLLQQFHFAAGPPAEVRVAAHTSIDNFVVSPDGTRVVTELTDDTTWLWNLQTGKTISLLDRETRIQPIRFSRDSSRLLTGDPAAKGRNSVQIWDAVSGLKLLRVEHDGRLLSDGFTPDGNWIVAQPFGEEKTVRFWSVEPAALAKRMITRTMTADEREFYQFGTREERNSHRRRAALDKIYESFELLRTADTSESGLHSRIQPFLDRTLDHLASELEDDASAAELSDVTAMIDRLLDAGTVASAPLLRWQSDLFASRGDRVRAIRMMERAVQLPDATRSDEDKLEELRREAEPDLVSYASIEAVLALDDDSRNKLLSAFCKAVVGENAKSLLRYLDARLARNEGRFDDAIRGYRTLIEQHDTHPEPYLRLAECLSANAEYSDAARVLQDALNYPACRTPNLWNRWAAIALADEGLSPSELLQIISTSDAASQTFSGSSAENLKWLLRQLADGQAIRINCGGDKYTDIDGNPWAADRFFTHGFPYFQGNGQFTEEIDNTSSDPLYQTERYFDSERKFIPAGYQIPLPPGRYRVTLHFAEIYETGVRTFDTRIEGQTVLQNYDPSEVGFAKADVRTFEVAVQDGLLNIEFVAVKEAPKISAIEVEPFE